MPLIYDDVKLDCGFRADLLVDGLVLVGGPISAPFIWKFHGFAMNASRNGSDFRGFENLGSFDRE